MLTQYRLHKRKSEIKAVRRKYFLRKKDITSALTKLKIVFHKVAVLNAREMNVRFKIAKSLKILLEYICFHFLH